MLTHDKRLFEELCSMASWPNPQKHFDNVTYKSLFYKFTEGNFDSHPSNEI